MTLTRTVLLKASVERGVAQVASAHSPLSARLVEEAGFDGIWASGFELSALYGVPDASLVSMTQQLDMVRAMAEQVNTPIVADLDTGYGNAVNAVHAVRAFERAGAAAIVIEDKRFPKATSLLEGAQHELVSVEEFEGKLLGALETRSDPAFQIIARTEALIAGLGLNEALHRATRYASVGADLVLVHSKQSTPSEILSFARHWGGPCPLAIVPTAYPSLSMEEIEMTGNIRMVIYGNHTIRASITAMQRVLAEIREDGNAGRAHAGIVPVREVFRLQRTEMYDALESRYIR